MAVDIESFKRDLDELKNQRSVIQAKLDEANRHLSELTETLKGMGFNSVADAKQQMQDLTDSEQIPIWQIPVQLLVGIIGCLLVYHLRNKSEGKRRMHTISAAMTEAGKPYKRICKPVHLLLQ